MDRVWLWEKFDTVNIQTEKEVINIYENIGDKLNEWDLEYLQQFQHILATKKQEIHTETIQIFRKH